MKIIDLLNKIANGEEVPKKIKYRDWLYEFKKNCNDYMCQYDSLLCRENDDVRQFLNDEVEILGEEKKTKPLTKKDIEALGYACGEIQKCFINGWDKSLKNKSLEEEKKIPEKLNIEDDGNTITLFGEKENEWTILDNVDIIVCNKINELIDYLDYVKSKGE